MKLTLTLLFLVGFIAFIGAVPEEAQDAPVADPEKETAAEDASPDEQDKNEDDEFHADQVPIEGSEAEQDEDADLDMPEQELKEGEQDADEENDEETYQRINDNYFKAKGMEVKLSNTKLVIRMYNSNKPLPLLGKSKAYVESKDKVITTTFYVTEGNPVNLLSFNSCVNLELIQKCEFNKTLLEFFGFVFSDGGMKPDPKNVEDIQNLEPPNVKELRSVLVMTGYSSRFIQDYAIITGPLRELTHKNSSWNWTTTHQEAFETLKEKLQSAPALAYFDISKSTEIAVDASPVGLGTILTQKDENGHFML
ncbi:hypothetical protein QZH41_006658 [Actinostola sp. cb2023]|nr:hypothetical protein QZH41_006658 [Actinostola sp. cb2023]